MNNSKRVVVLLTAIWLVSGISLTARGEGVENVVAIQREGTRLVDVWYDLVSETGRFYNVSLAIRGKDELPVSTVKGHVGDGVVPGKNRRIVWNAGADWPERVESNLTVTVTAARRTEEDDPDSFLEGMVHIPGGSNGSVPVEPFWMDRTEVTYAHWQRVYNWAVKHGYSFSNPGDGDAQRRPNHPVHSVDWYDCAKWCNARSEIEGLTPLYTWNGEVYRTGEPDTTVGLPVIGAKPPIVDLSGNGYRLPTTNEWEYAAHGGSASNTDTISPEEANYSSGGTMPVGSYPPNAFGLYDIFGNVWEWTTTRNVDKWALCGGSWYQGSLGVPPVGAGGHIWDNPWLIGYSSSAYTSLSHEGNYGFRTVRRGAD